LCLTKGDTITQVAVMVKTIYTAALHVMYASISAGQDAMIASCLVNVLLCPDKQSHIKQTA